MTEEEVWTALRKNIENIENINEASINLILCEMQTIRKKRINEAQILASPLLHKQQDLENINETYKFLAFRKQMVLIFLCCEINEAYINLILYKTQIVSWKSKRQQHLSLS